MPQRFRPRLRARPISRPPAPPWRSSSSSRSKDSALAAVRERRQLGVLLPVGNGVEAERRRLRHRVELRQPQGEAVTRLPHGKRASRLRVATHVGVVRVRPQLAEPREVGVGIEHDDPQVGLEQELLEHDAERIGLAGARLAAEKRVPPEAAGVECERYARGEHQLPDLEPGSPRGGLLEVDADLVGRRRPHRGVVERRAVAAQDPALALGAADHDLRPVCELAAVGRVELEPLLPADAERDDLAEPALGALLERDVRARLQRETVQRRLIGEAAPVDRGRERKDLLLEPLPDGSIPVEALLHAHSRGLNWRSSSAPGWTMPT